VVFGKNQASFMYENVLCILVEFNEREVRVIGKRNVHNGVWVLSLGKCIEFRIVVGMWIVRGMSHFLLQICRPVTSTMISVG